MTTEPNVELLRQTMDEILAHPEKHYQKAWATTTAPGCGTAYCFAGLACVLSGLEVDWTRLDDGDAWYLTTGNYIEEEARRLLGLDRFTACDLFSAFNDTTQLKHYVDEICEHGLIRAAQTEPVSE